MTLQFCSLGSGSKGNSYVIKNGHGNHILIDAGLSCREIISRLTQINVMPESISAIFITHNHSDHIKGLVPFFNKFAGVEIFASEDTASEIELKLQRKINNIKSFDTISHYSFEIESFPLSHDEATIGYTVIDGGKQISILTDTGTVNASVIDAILSSNMIVIESNHDVDMLRENPNYPDYIKSRILSNRGHLSNKQCAETICKILDGNDNLDTLLLAHLSEENNTVDKAMTEMIDSINTRTSRNLTVLNIDVLQQHEVSGWYEI